MGLLRCINAHFKWAGSLRAARVELAGPRLYKTTRYDMLGGLRKEASSSFLVGLKKKIMCVCCMPVHWVAGLVDKDLLSG